MSHPQGFESRTRKQFARTDKGDGCKGQGKTACTCICPQSAIEVRHCADITKPGFLTASGGCRAGKADELIRRT